LEANYGAQEARAIWDLVNTTLYFRAPSGSVAEWVQKELGETRLLKFRDQYSYGVDTIRDGVNFSKEDTREKIVSFSDIQNLDDLECFVSLRGNVPIVKLTLEHKQYETIAAGKIERDVSAIFDNQIEQELNKSGIENKAEAIASNTFNNDKKANTNSGGDDKNAGEVSTSTTNEDLPSGTDITLPWETSTSNDEAPRTPHHESTTTTVPLDEYQDINNNNPRKIEHEKSV
ncbi:type IV secretion system DNA-binding domain-containing protein, partial [Arsenophonus apicola]|uniref:type IV secretion system DNA-binding domain-containing protein n=1 Tax=Arsenophonus apicola TaxID=2879119 RepID=UPI003879D253